MEIPFGLVLAPGLVWVLRLHMTSTAWASCVAEDDTMTSKVGCLGDCPQTAGSVRRHWRRSPRFVRQQQPDTSPRTAPPTG